MEKDVKIGEKIRIQRLVKGYSQEYMAFALDISQAAYSNLERGETDITLKRIYEIAEVLKVSAFELMPRPRYGFSINQAFFWKRINKFQAFWVQEVRNRLKGAPESVNVYHGDNS